MRESTARLVIGLWVLSALVPWTVTAQLKLLESGPRHLKVLFEVDQLDRAREGASCLVGLPLQGEVQLEVLEAHIGWTLSGDEAIGLDWVESGPVSLGKEGMLRDQRVVELGFSPHKRAESVDIYDRVLVLVSFDGGAFGGGKGRRDRWGEALYGQLLINEDQARDWRQVPRGARAKTAQDFGGGSAFKVVVREEGIYRIDGRSLSEAGLNLTGLSSDQVQLYYGGGRALSLAIRANYELNLSAVPIIVEDGGDGRLDPDDYILFYGEGPSRWEWNRLENKYVYRFNVYTDDNVYWLVAGSEGEAVRPQQRSGEPVASDAVRPTSYRVRFHSQEEQFIQIQTYGIKSGYHWYAEDFRGNARNFPVVVRNAAEGPVDIRLRMIGTNGLDKTFTIKWNEAEVNQVEWFTSRPTLLEAQSEVGPVEGLNTLGLIHSGGGVRMDWFELEFNRQFVADRGEISFDLPGDAAGGITEVRLSGFETEPRIFMVSDQMSEVVGGRYDATEGTVVFQDKIGNRPSRYMAVTEAAWKKVVSIVADIPSQLRAADNGAEYLLVTHRDFLVPAQRLANWRAADGRFGRPLRTAVVTMDDIYDEFTGGLSDPAALRNFVRYAFENWDPPPFFVALLGDGSYDYKNNSGTSQGNWIPPFQDGDSTYDEWYVRVSGDDVLPDLAIGRMPVQTEAEAEIVVDKLIEYDRNPEVGPWQSRILLVADDIRNPSEPNTIESFFINDAERMANNWLPTDLDIAKLYVGQFPLEGLTKPKARDAFISRFNEGALILTYIGHGSWDVLAHEQLFVVSRDVGQITNGRRLPFMYAAASQVGPFDDPSRSAMPEIMLKKPDGGVIGMIAATRVGFHNSNMVLANQFHEQMYRSGRRHVPVGLAFMEAKRMVEARVNSTDLRNIQRYSIFGDPALYLGRPQYQVQLELPDTLRALEEVRAVGQVLDGEGGIASGFDGEAWVQVFDSSVRSKLEGYNYQQIGTTIYRGFVPVRQGKLEVVFRVPKDITYQGRLGRISAYAWAESLPTAFGSVDQIVLSGTAEGVTPDEVGPQIEIGFVGRRGFKSGDLLPAHSVLQAQISDDSGINVTGETGHEIEVRIGDEIFGVTEFFANRDGSYQSGLVEYPLPALEPGPYTIRLKAWDSFNNSAQAEIDILIGEDKFGLSDVLFHPNPMRDEGHFTYILSAPSDQVQIKVFTLSGIPVDELEGEGRQGYNQVPWAPRQDLASGTYLYRIEVSGEAGSADKTAVLQVIR